MAQLSVFPLASETVIVIPCYNEADRLPVASIEAYVALTDRVRFIFVNDGSTDETSSLLNELVSRNPKRLEYLDLEENCGKAEAIRRGFLHAIEKDFEVIGFWDADLSTPLQPIENFRSVLDLHESIEMVVGSRISLLGRDIQRNLVRRALGKLFATTASMALGFRIHDTQCGAKMFRVTPHLKEVFAEPFSSKWIFDVELIARYIQLLNQSDRQMNFIYEQPLDQWKEIDGSRLQSQDFLTAVLDLANIYWRHLRPGARPYISANRDELISDSPAAKSNQANESRAA